MKIMESLRYLAASIACMGMLVPTAAFASPPVSPASGKSVVIKDIALSTGNVLQGQVVDEQGNAQANVQVLLRRGDQGLQATTDHDGRFAVSGLRGGIYQVKAGVATGIYRLWSVNTAPPVATDGMLLVSNEAALLRGQCPDGSCGAMPGYAPAGEYVAPGGYPAGPMGPCAGEVCGQGSYPPTGRGGVLGFLSNPWIIGLGVAAAIAIPLALDDDNKNKAS